MNDLKIAEDFKQFKLRQNVFINLDGHPYKRWRLMAESSKHGYWSTLHVFDHYKDAERAKKAWEAINNEAT